MKTNLLSGDQGLTLMRKLATDDDFRAGFESDPAAALSTLGISQDIIDKMDASCCQQSKLAPKSVFEELLEQPDSEQFHVAMSMHVQQLKIQP